jgi:hypothetical protein
MITMIGKDDGAIAHIGDNPNKVSVLSGGVSALLRRLSREDGVDGHRVRLHFAGGNGAYVQWNSLADAARGIATERPRPPIPTVTTWTR